MPFKKMLEEHRGKFLFAIVGTNKVNKQCRILSLCENKEKANEFMKDVNHKFGYKAMFDVVKICIENDTINYLVNHLMSVIDLNEFLMLDNSYKYYKIDSDYNWIEATQ